MTEPTTIGGLSCEDVLALLPDFIDGTLAPSDVGAVHEHLEGCTWCEQFGGSYAATVRSVRRYLRPPEGRDAEASRRLRERLARATGEVGGA